MSTGTTRLEPTLRVVSGVLTALATVCLLAVIGISALDVLIRYINGSGLLGAIQVVELIMVILTGLGLMVAQRHKDHVAIDLIAMYLPTKAAQNLRTIGFFLVSALFLVATWVSFSIALDSFTRHEVSVGVLELQVWPARIAIPVGLLALAFQLFVDGLESMRAEATDVKEEVMSQAENEVL